MPLRPLEPQDCTRGREIICVDSSGVSLVSSGKTYHILAFHPPDHIIQRQLSDKFEIGAVTLVEVKEWCVLESLDFGGFGVTTLSPIGFPLWRFRIFEGESASEARLIKEKERV